MFGCAKFRSAQQAQCCARRARFGFGHHQLGFGKESRARSGRAATRATDLDEALEFYARRQLSGRFLARLRSGSLLALLLRLSRFRRLATAGLPAPRPPAQADGRPSERRPTGGGAEQRERGAAQARNAKRLGRAEAGALAGARAPPLDPQEAGQPAFGPTGARRAALRAAARRAAARGARESRRSVEQPAGQRTRRTQVRLQTDARAPPHQTVAHSARARRHAHSKRQKRRYKQDEQQ